METVHGIDPAEKSGITASAALWVAVVLMTVLVAVTGLLAGTDAVTKISDPDGPTTGPSIEP